MATNAIRAVRRWWWLLLLATVVSGATAAYSASRTPRYYQATVTLMVGRTLQETNPNPNNVGLLDRLANLYANTATRDPVLSAAARSVTPPTSAAEIAPRVHVRSVTGAQSIEIAYLDENPLRAAQVVSAVANELMKQSPTPVALQSPQQRQFVERQLQDLQTKIGDAQAQIALIESGATQLTSAAEIADAQDRAKVLRTQLETWRTAYANLLALTQPSETNYLSVMEPAGIPTATVGPSKAIGVGIAAVFGLILAFGVALLIEYWDDTLRDAHGAKAYAPIPLLAVLRPASRNGPLATAPLRGVRNLLLRNRLDAPLRLLVVAPGSRAATGSTALGLAEAFAQSGRHVILVNADVASPGSGTTVPQHAPGFTEFVAGRASVEQVMHASATPGLLVVPAGMGDGDVLSAAGLPAALDTLLRHSRADVLIANGGELRDETNATCLLAQHFAFTVLVVHGRIRARILARTVGILAEAGTHAVGMVFAPRGDAPAPSPHPLAGYTPLGVREGARPEPETHGKVSLAFETIAANGTARRNLSALNGAEHGIHD